MSHAAHQASLSSTISWSLPKFVFIESVMLPNHLILCHPLLLLPSVFPSIRVSSNEMALRVSWPKYWSFSFSISPSNEYSELISFRTDWFDLLAVQGPLKGLLQHHVSCLCHFILSLCWFQKLIFCFTCRKMLRGVTVIAASQDSIIWRKGTPRAAPSASASASLTFVKASPGPSVRWGHLPEAGVGGSVAGGMEIMTTGRGP